MINYDDELIVLSGKVEKIERFEVWWVTPEGLEKTLHEAKLAMQRLEMDLLLLRPVSVAIGKTTYEVLFR